MTGQRRSKPERMMALLRNAGVQVPDDVVIQPLHRGKNGRSRGDWAWQLARPVKERAYGMMIDTFSPAGVGSSWTITELLKAGSVTALPAPDGEGIEITPEAT